MTSLDRWREDRQSGQLRSSLEFQNFSLNSHLLTVRATTRSGRRPRGEKHEGRSLPGSLLRLEMSFPHTTLRAVT